MKKTIKQILILLLILAATVFVIWLLPVKVLLAVIIFLQLVMLFVMALASKDIIKPTTHEEES